MYFSSVVNPVHEITVCLFGMSPSPHRWWFLTYQVCQATLGGNLIQQHKVTSIFN